MIDDFVQDLHQLQKADALIGKIWLKNLACQFGLFVFAGLIADCMQCRNPWGRFGPPRSSR